MPPSDEGSSQPPEPRAPADAAPAGARRATSVTPRGRHGGPFPVGEVVSASFRIWIRQFVPLTILALVVHAPSTPTVPVPA